MLKSLFTFIRSLFSMGCLGVILLLMAAAIFFGALAAVDIFASFETIWQRLDALTALENQASRALREMELSELYFAFALEYETGVSNELEQAAGYADELQRTLDELVAQGHFTAELEYAPEITALVTELQQKLAQHRQTFAQQAQAYQAGEFEAARQLGESSEAENFELQALLDELTTRVNAERLAATRQFPQDLLDAAWGNSLAILALLLLALGGYRAINRLTQPLTELTSAVIAIGGDHYHPELLEEPRRLRNPTGRLARSLEAFVQAIEARDAAAKQSIMGLKEKLAQSRRQRLKLTARDKPAASQPAEVQP